MFVYGSKHRENFTANSQIYTIKRVIYFKFKIAILWIYMDMKVDLQFDNDLREVDINLAVNKSSAAENLFRGIAQFKKKNKY